MMKKKILLLGTTLISATALTLGAVTAMGAQADLNKLSGANEAEWSHYSGVSPSYDQKGIKEYWVSCSTHEHQFTAPTSGTIVDRGAPSEAFINSLADDDTRLLAPSWNTINFASSSDLDLVSSARNNFSVKEIVDDSTAPDHDGKVLKVMYKDGTAEFRLAEAYLDKVFADSSVVGLNFNMKATLEKDISYRTQATTTRYEGNGANNFGLNTTWKTFQLPRSAYESFKADPNKSQAARNTMLWTGLSTQYDTFELYLDNFQPARKVLDWTGFERGRYNNGAAYLSWREGAVGSGGSEVFYAMDGNSTTTVNWSFDDSVKSEGGRSIKISRATSDNLKLGFNSNQVKYDNLLPSSTSVLSFDFRSSKNLNCNASVSSILICGTTKLSSGTNFQIPGNTWCRIAIPKSKLVNYSFFTFHGGAEMDVWVDNIQFDTDLGCFEDDTLIRQTDNVWSYNGEYTNSSNHTNVDYTKIRTMRVQGTSGNVSHVGLSYSRHTEGNSSLWIKQVRGNVETALYLSTAAKKFLTDNAGSTITLDMFRTSSGTCTFNNGNRNALTPVPQANTWTTITLTNDDLTSDGRAIIYQGSNTIGDWYVDNISYNLA